MRCASRDADSPVLEQSFRSLDQSAGRVDQIIHNQAVLTLHITDHLHDFGNIISRKIRPAVAKAGLEWKGLYSGRRGACTAMVEATGGNYAVAQALLRHKSMKTTLDVYKKAITPEAFKAGMKKLAATNGSDAH